MKKLSNLEAAEVSLVPRGANKRKFLIVKESEEKDKLLEQVAKPDPEMMKRVDKILKEAGEGETGMNTRAQAAVKAVVRILTPFKEEIDDSVLDSALTEAGFYDSPENGGSPLEGEAGAKVASAGEMSMSNTKPEGVSDEHHEAAMKEAGCAYKSHLEKMGYQKYPANQPAMKASKKKDDENEEDEDDEDVEKGSKDLKEIGKGSTMAEKVQKESEVLEAVPKQARPALEAIFKEHQDTVKALVQKNADLEKIVQDERQARRKKEFVEKASKYKHYVGDRDTLATELMDLGDKSPALLEKVEKQLEAADKLAEEGSKGVFKELGSNQARGQGHSWEAIEKAAEGYVAKSGDKVTKEQATDIFLRTPEGQRMYAEHQKERGGI